MEREGEDEGGVYRGGSVGEPRKRGRNGMWMKENEGEMEKG